MMLNETDRSLKMLRGMRAFGVLLSMATKTAMSTRPTTISPIVRVLPHPQLCAVTSA